MERTENNKKHRICIITKIGAHYRLPIFKLMREEFSCDFYMGDKIENSLKTFDDVLLNGYTKSLENIYIGPFYWQRGSIRALLKPYKYYILDGEPLCLSSWVILIVCKLLRKKTIAWTHGWYGREGKIKKIIKKTFYQLFDRLMLYNRYSIRLMEDIGFNPTIIYCGRIQKVKRVEDIVRAIKILRDRNVMVNAIFVGKDVESINIDLHANALGVADQVWLYGPCYDEQILGELFYNAHVCVSPGNVGLTAIHALSFGCPVITHDNFPYQMPEFEAIASNVTGDFFKQNVLADLADKIEKWASLNTIEREKARIAAMREIDNKWNIHYQIETIKQVIQSFK